MRIGKNAASHRAQVVAVVVELHQRVFATVKYEDIVLGVNRDAGTRAKIDTRGQLKNISDGRVTEIGDSVGHGWPQNEMIKPAIDA